MVILMKPNKILVVSKPSRLFQKENAVDNIVFYVPEKYNGFELKNFIATLYYTNPANDAISELLVAESTSDKEGFLQYSLPVTTKITKLPGTISLYLSFVHNDVATMTSYVLKTSTLDIEIETWEDYFKYLPNDSLATIDNKIAELDAKIAEIKAIADMEIPDDLALTREGHLQLSVDGSPIGDGVNVVVTNDDTDGTDDGVLDFDVVGI